MDDFWGERNNRMGKFDPFWDDMFPSRNQFGSPFSILHESMNQMHRDMDRMMRHAFGNFGGNFPNHQTFPAIDNGQRAVKDQDLDKQVQQYGVNSIFDDDFYSSDWDFVKHLEQLEKQPKQTDLMTPGKDSGVKFYGKSHFYNYQSTGDGKVEERKLVQDTRGNRLESVQRKLGDRLWARTTKQKEGGQIDEDEKMLNMSEEDKEKFIHDWRSANTGLPYNSIAIDKSIDVPDKPKKQSTLPSLEKKSSDDWFDKFKFWKK